MAAQPITSQAALPQAIRLLGATGFEQALWVLLRAMAAPDNLAILIYRDAGPPEVLFTKADQTQVFSELHSTYADGAYLLDPYYDLHLRRVPADVYRMRDVAPDAFQRSRYFTEYYERTTLIDELTFIAYPVPGVSLNLCLGRDTSSGQVFAPRQINACKQMAGVIVALAERHWQGLTARPGPVDDIAALLIRSAQSAHDIRLSRRQAEVALLILRGHSSLSIGLRLGVSPQTIKVFRKQLYGRCSISSQAELFALLVPLLKGAM